MLMSRISTPSSSYSQRKWTLYDIRVGLGLKQIYLVRMVQEYAEQHKTVNLTPTNLSLAERLLFKPSMPLRVVITIVLDDFMRQYNMRFRRNSLGLADDQELTHDMIQWEKEEEEQEDKEEE